MSRAQMYDGTNWVDMGSGGVVMPAYGDTYTGGTVSGSAYAWKGTKVVPNRDITIYGLVHYGTVVSGATYQAAVVTVSGGVVATIEKSISVVATAEAARADTGRLTLAFATPVTMVKDADYFLAIGRTDSTDAYAFGAGFTETVPFPFGRIDSAGSIRIAKANPTIGDTVDISSSMTTSMGAYFTDDDMAGLGSSVYAGTWLDALFTRPEAAHSDDQEFDDFISGTEVTPAGTAAWTQKRSLLGVEYDDQASQDWAVRLYPLSATSWPVTIETIITHSMMEENYHKVGIAFTDGTVTSSNIVVGYLDSATSSDSQMNIKEGAITEVGGSSVVSEPGHGSYGSPLYLRLIWSASNTFKIQWSANGVAWTDGGMTTLAKTMTPTYIGVGATTGGGSKPGAAAFEYIRVTESDLSA